MIRLETTRTCPRALVLAFALEEAGRPWSPILRPAGWFQANHGRIGPFVHEDDRVEHDPVVVLRRLLPAGPWLGRLAEALPTLARGGDARGLLAEMEARLAAAEWLEGGFGAADCLAPGFARPEAPPAVAGWAARATARPGFARARVRLAAEVPA